MHQHHYSHYEELNREVASFESKENFASPAAAKAALEKVESRQAQVCQGHLHGNPGCPCLYFCDVRAALRYAALGSQDPWASVREERRRSAARKYLNRGRELAGRIHRSRLPEKTAEAAGNLLGSAYKYFLG
jgi:hypothetical protein